MRANNKRVSDKSTGRSRVTWEYFDIMNEYFGKEHYSDPAVEQLEDTIDVDDKVYF